MPVILWTDALIAMLLALTLGFGVYAALGGKNRRSFPIRFLTRRGTIDRPEKEILYTAP